MFDWLQRKLSPPGIEAPRRRCLFRTISLVAGCVKEDIAYVLRQWFPLTSDQQALDRHGQILKVPRFKSDRDEDFRYRVASAGSFLEGLGRLAFTKRFLQQTLLKEHKLIQHPMDSFTIARSKLGYAPLGGAGGGGVIVKIKGMTESEQKGIFEFLDFSLDPDLEIYVLPWIDHPTPRLTVEMLRQRGGSKWLEKELADLDDCRVELYPDDGFCLSYTPIGSARLIWQYEPVVRVLLSQPTAKLEVVEKLEKILKDGVNREVL